MSAIGCHTGGTSDVVKCEVSDQRICLEEEGEGLADTTAGSKDGDLFFILDGIYQITDIILTFEALNLEVEKDLAIEAFERTERLNMLELTVRISRTTRCRCLIESC